MRACRSVPVMTCAVVALGVGALVVKAAISTGSDEVVRLAMATMLLVVAGCVLAIWRRGGE